MWNKIYSGFINIQWDWQTIAAVVSILAIVTGVIVKYGGKIFRKVWHWLSRYKPYIPRETVRVIPQTHRNEWHEGKVDGVPAMQVEARWHVTNISDRPVRLLGARIIHPYKARVNAAMLFVRHPEKNVYGVYTIQPGDTIPVSASFWVVPPFRKKGEGFNATIILIDQYGNEHKIKKYLFEGPKILKPTKHIPQEAIYTMSDPIEKEIVAVLKDEVNRYSFCGRRVGGLGSIQTTYKGKTYAGVGSDWREANSPKNQAITLDPKNVYISSDNASALLNLYLRLKNEDDNSSSNCKKFRESLLKRLSRDGEYASVGYLIMFILFHIGHLPAALEKAKQDLQGDDEYGFSDLLILLDGLLRHEHPSFTPELLDTIEESLSDMNEHKFRILERIAAIRAFRLAQPKEVCQG